MNKVKHPVHNLVLGLISGPSMAHAATPEAHATPVSGITSSLNCRQPGVC